MKKLAFIPWLCLLIVLFSGCNTRIISGTQLNLGEYRAILSNGENDYLEYDGNVYDDRYIEILENDFSLTEVPSADTVLQETESDVEQICSVMTWRGRLWRAEYAGGYEFLSDKLIEWLGEGAHFECLILKNGEEIYGAVNCYQNSSGLSGNLLSHEDIEKSYLVDVRDQEIVVNKELTGAEILAFNQTHYIAYGGRILYSGEQETNQKTILWQKRWWEPGLSTRGYAKFYFTDLHFYVYANNGKLNNSETIFACNMDGTGSEILIEKADPPRE